MLPEELEIGKQYYCYSRLDKKKEYKIVLIYEGIDMYSASFEKTKYVFYEKSIEDTLKLEEDKVLELMVYEK